MLSRKAIAWNLGILFFLAVGFVVIAPRISNAIIFQGILLNWPYAFTLIIAIAIAWPMFNGLDGRRSRRSIIGLIVVFSLMVISWIAMGTFTNYLTYHTYANFSQREKLVASDPSHLRFTPLGIAFRDIENSITAATEEVKLEYTNPLITKDGFSYVSAITPDGVLPTWASDNPGFVFYNDKAGVRSKVQRIEQEQTYGLGELWFDNFWQPVFRSDWWATYESPHFLRLDPENPESFTAVVPKVKYSFLRLPYWAGVVLVHADGEIEDITVDEALKDKRLAGQWIAPLNLMRDYVEHQNYAVGYLSSFFRVPGKLEIDDVEGLNEFPFITRGADGRDYFVVATKAEGSGGGLFRMYFATADNFELTYYEFDSTNVVYGPNAALKRVFNLQGYNWHRQTSNGESGNMTAIEPVYVVRPGDEDNLYWKFSITTKEMTGISGTALISGSNLDIFRDFKTRDEFDHWLNSTAPLHAGIVRELETITGEAAPEGLSLADQIRWHAEQIRVLTEKIQE